LEPGSHYQVQLVTRQTGEDDITATIARDGGLLGVGSHSDTAKIERVELFALETGGGVSKHGSGFFTLKQDEEGATFNPSTKGLALLCLGWPGWFWR